MMVNQLPLCKVCFALVKLCSLQSFLSMPMTELCVTQAKKKSPFDHHGFRLQRQPPWITRKWNTREDLAKYELVAPSGSDVQAAPSPPQLIEWDQRRRWSVRWNWCGHQVQDSLTARLAWAPFDCRYASEKRIEGKKKEPSYHSPLPLTLSLSYYLLKAFTGDKRVPNDLINCFIISVMGVWWRWWWQEHIFSSEIRRESLPPPGSF